MENSQIDSSPKMQKATNSNEKVVSGTASASQSGDPSGSLADYPMENNLTYVHGRVDPGFDESIHLVEGMAVQKSLEEGHHHSFLGPLDESEEGIMTPYNVSQGNTTPDKCFLVSLPSELVEHILSFLSPVDLTIISTTCRLLLTHARSDLSWQRHVQSNVPGTRLGTPAPYKTFRELYAAHDPHWFLTKYKIWFSDYFLTGKLIIARYDPRKGCIEGYRLVAERPPPDFATWESDDEVIIHSFDPKCKLHMDEPVLQLTPRSISSSLNNDNIQRFNAETPMPIGPAQRTVFANFVLTRAVQERPNMALWPPPNIPSLQRVRNKSQESFSGAGHKPQKRSEVCHQAFRTRRWIQMAESRSSAPGVHMGEEVSTYSTLDPKLYTPTEDKPWRGIWVGDYSGHGCEFLLMNQPDNKEPFDESKYFQYDDETWDEFQIRKREARIYRGRIEAIKLTGDPNIPRGEYTFIADDIGENGFVRVADEERFKGARVVKSRGHIASRMYIDDKYIASQLILLSPNRLAQHWIGFGHISYFERVNIDDFLTPPSELSKEGQHCPQD